MDDGHGSQLKTNYGVSSAVIQQRLRTLLDLAVAIGRREGLLENEAHPELDGAGPAVICSTDVGQTTSNETDFPRVTSQLEEIRRRSKTNDEGDTDWVTGSDPNLIGVESDHGMSKTNREGL